MTSRWNIDLSWLVGVAFCAALAVGFRACTDGEKYNDAARIYQNCLATAVKTPQITCEAPKP